MLQQIDRHRTPLEAYEKLCRDLSQQSANMALAWLLNQPP